MPRVLWRVAIVCAVVGMAACTRPKESEQESSARQLESFAREHEAELRESFAQQLAANRFVKDFQRNGEELTFSGPGAEGGVGKWRVRIDSAVIEPNYDPAQLDKAVLDPAQPYRGVVKSSWYSDNRLVTPRGRESNLPIELTSNGLAQDCWANWVKDTKKWSWE